MRTPHARPEDSSLARPASRKRVRGSPELLEDDARTVLHRANPGEEEAGALELRLEREGLLGRGRTEEPACRLCVVRKREQLVRHALALHVRACEVAVARIAAGANA